MSKLSKIPRASAIDLFCGAGGLTHGLLEAGLPVLAGVDLDPACQYPFESNNKAAFILQDIACLKGKALRTMWPQGQVRVLVGCAPCQPFSRYTQKLGEPEREKWGLLNHFTRIIREVKPHVISMENVPELCRHRMFGNFVNELKGRGYFVTWSFAFCPAYGIPQQRTRLVLLASLLGEMALEPPSHTPEEYPTVRDAISHLLPLKAGDVDFKDPLHRACDLAPINLRRICASRPGGTWRDWPRSLIARCHRTDSGKTYPSVYGRMEWDKPAPTITTQFFGFGNGRFGHPEQNRALSLREGALLQSFPASYQFVPKGGKVSYSELGRLIGNAVPVRLGKVIGVTILRHLASAGVGGARQTKVA